MVAKGVVGAERLDVELTEESELVPEPKVIVSTCSTIMVLAIMLLNLRVPSAIASSQSIGMVMLTVQWKELERVVRCYRQNDLQSDLRDGSSEE